MVLNHSLSRVPFLRYNLFTIFALFFVFLITGIGLNAQVDISGTSYSNLSLAFAAINAGSHTGNITVTINGNVTETSTAILMPSGNGSANYNSVRVYPTGEYTVSGSCSSALIELRGADNVTIDGRINQTGTTNSLTLINNYTSTASVIWVDSLTSGVGAGAHNNTIRNCNIIGYSTTYSGSYGIVTGSSAGLTTGGRGNDSLQILYNTFKKVYYGIRIYGASTTAGYQIIRPIIKYNTFGSENNNETVGYYGIYMYYVDDAIITDNYLFNLNPTSAFYAMYFYYTKRDFVNNNRIANCNTVSTVYGVRFYKDVSSTFSNNLMTNIKSTGSTIYGMYTYYSKDLIVKNNKFTNFTGYSNIYGMYNYYDTTSVYDGNIIHSLINDNSSSYYTIYGINNYYGTGNLIINNCISNIKNSYNALSTGNPTGLYLYYPYSVKVYHNSIYLTGANLGTNANGTQSQCMYFACNSSYPVDIQNNTFVNTMTGPTGYTSYILAAYNGSTYPASSTVNYNNLYTNGTYLGYYSGYRANLSAWQTASGYDANSISSSPLHNSEYVLIPRQGSPLIDAGTPLSGYAWDLLGNTRSTSRPYIGAYEINGDYAGPEFSYTALTKTTSLSNRTLTNVEITDPSGVNNTTGTKPRIYFKKTTNANTLLDNTNSTNGWKYVEATNTSSPFSFTIDYSLIYGGVTQNDIIQYFIVAQDLASTVHVGIDMGVFNDEPTSVALTSANFPIIGNVNSYAIGFNLSGTLFVGNSETINSISNEGGLFQTINNGNLIGNLTVYVTSDLTSETGLYSLYPIDEQGTGSYTITIKPNSAQLRTISGTTTSGGLIRLLGADRVVIDGRYNGSGTYFTIRNYGTSNSSVIQFASLGVNAGATYNTVRNCNLIAGSYGSSGCIPVLFSGNTPGTGTGADNDYNNILYNNISNGYYGIYVYGTSTGYNDYVQIIGNKLGADSYTSSLYYYAMYFYYTNNSTVADNLIYNMNTTTYLRAIYLSSYVTNTKFSNNIFRDLVSNSSYMTTAFYVASTSSCNCQFDNNIIYNIMNNGQTGVSYMGTGFYFSSGSGYKVYHNTVYLSGNRDTYGSRTAFSPSACIYLSSSISTMDMRNNIFINTQTAPTNIPYSYAVYCNGTTSVFTNSDYNNFYVSGAQAMLTYFNGSSYSSLSNWQSVSGRDYNSRNLNIEFMGSTDFHLNGTSVGNPSLLCPAITGVTTDMDGETRRTSNVNMGADEVRPTFTFNPDLNQYSGVFCNGDEINFTYTPSIAYGDNIDRKLGAYQPTYSWFRNNNQISGETKTTLDISPVSAANAGTYFGRVSFMGDNTNTRNSVITVHDPISIVSQPESVIVCKSIGKHILSAGSIGTISNYKWQKLNKVTGQYNDVIGQNESTYSVNLNTLDVLQPDPLIYQSVYRVIIEGPGYCGPPQVISEPAAITCFAPVTNVTITSNRPAFNPCLDKEYRMTVTAQGTIYGYQWQKSHNNVFKDIELDYNPTAQDETLVINNCRIDDGGIYRVLIYGSDYCGEEKTYSIEIKVKVLVPIEIISEPENQNICEGEEASLGVVADGTVYSYKWYLDGAEIDTNKYPSAAKAFYFIEDAKYEQSGLYTCRLAVEDCEGERYLYTNPVLVSVNAKTDITRQPLSQAKALGETAVFEFDSHVLGHLEDFQLQPTIQWYKVTGSPSTTITMIDEYGVNGRISGTKSNIMTITNVQDDDYNAQYYAVITGYCGTSITNYCNIVKPGEIIVNLAPQDQEICAKDTATVALIASSSVAGVDVLYQWFFKGQAITDNDKYEGTKTNVLLVKDIENSDAGLYTVKLTLSNGDPAETTLQAVLTVAPELDEIASSEGTPTYKETETMELWAVVVGSSDITYKWFKDGVEIAGETSSSYTKTDIKTSDAGEYTLKVTDNICKDEFTFYFNVTVTTINISGVDEAMAGELTLLNNTPNPFESVTEISFISAISQEVKLVINDIYGREVSTLFNGNCKVGLNQFKFDSALQNLTTGTYSYTLIANGKAITKKMILIK